MTDTEALWWGTTSSSLQSEGAAPSADWIRWEQSNRVPASSDGNGIGSHHHEDFELLASLGMTHVRLTLEWARLEPEPGRIDADAFDRYDDMLSSARTAGLQVIATLQSQTLPGWYSEDTPGHRDEHGREYLWARHVDRCAERFGGDVAMWVPIDDPIGWALRGHLLATRPPARRDPETLAYAIEGAMLANHVAHRLLAGGEAPTMAVFGTPTIFTHGPDAQSRRQWWHDVVFGTWMSALRDGELVIPGLAPREMPELAGTFDVIGLSHDHPIALDRAGDVHAYPAEARRADSGFTPIADEVAELLAYVASEMPGRKLMIAGHGVPTADDEWREAILSRTVDLVIDAADHAIPVIGYLHDTGIDGYEGPYGFSVQRGLITRDRALRPSAEWLRERLSAARATP